MTPTKFSLFRIISQLCLLLLELFWFKRNNSRTVDEVSTLCVENIVGLGETFLQGYMEQWLWYAIIKGKVRSIQPYGAFVEIMPGKDGLLHISEVTHERIQTLEGLLEVGQEIDVKLVEIDKKTGKYRLSRKVLLPKPEAAVAGNGEAQA